MPTPDLAAGELTLLGRITTASNATFLAQIGERKVVYKPIDGEKPLWDFPTGTLAHREVAAHLVSEAMGWDLVPHTWLRTGPLGEGMVQLWQESDPAAAPVDLIESADLPESGWLPVLEGRGENGKSVTLVHEDSPALRRMAVFDVVINNADRKGDHILPVASGHRYGVDHGVTFHEEPKLRTVLWGWLGEALTAAEKDGVARVLEALGSELGRELAPLLGDVELAALAQRCEQLLQAGTFPAPSGDMPAVPWPLF